MSTDDDFYELLADYAPRQDPPPQLTDELFARINDDELASRRRKPRAWMAAAAAFALFLAGTGVVLDRSETTVSQQASPGEQAMHEIMGANDAMVADGNASGARLQVVSSNSMDKGGAMVDGQPNLGPGMGAQVWTVDGNGSMISAGVIGQDSHRDVWMPFNSGISSVIVTEDPAGGRAHPSGRELAVMKLTPKSV